MPLIQEDISSKFKKQSILWIGVNVFHWSTLLLPSGFINQVVVVIERRLYMDSTSLISTHHC